MFIYCGQSAENPSVIDVTSAAIAMLLSLKLVRHKNSYVRTYVPGIYYHGGTQCTVVFIANMACKHDGKHGFGSILGFDYYLPTTIAPPEYVQYVRIANMLAMLFVPLSFFLNKHGSLFCFVFFL